MKIDYLYLYEFIAKTTLILVILLALTRFLGNKQMSQLTFFDYITGITIGSIAGNIITSLDEPLIEEIIGLIWWCILSVLLGYISLKFPRIRILLDGEPTIVIKKGIIQKKVLKSLKVNIDDLSMLLRQQGIFSFNEVSYAILESDGKLSVLKKFEYQNPTKKDHNIKKETQKYIPSEIISDGKVVKQNLKELGLTPDWLKSQLNSKGYTSIEDIFYAEIQADGTLLIFEAE